MANENIPHPGAEASVRDLGERISAKWAFALCAAVVVISLAAAMYVLFSGSTPSVLQGRLAITFACFSMSCVIGLLFASTAQRSHSSGRIGLLSLVLVGPGAFFIACLVIYNWEFPEDRIELRDPMTLKKLSEITTDVEKRAGWVDLEGWKQEIKTLLPLFERDEQSNVDLFLSTVYVHGNDNHKLNAPLIQTAFFYGPPSVDNKIARIKITRISGYKAKDTAWIYFNAQAPEYIPTVRMFFKHPSGQIEVSNSRSNWESVADDPVDCLIVGLYPAADIHEGDLILVNPTRYLKLGSGSTVDFTVFSIVPRLDSKLWEIHSAGVLEGDNVPLLFRQFISQEKQNDPGLMSTDPNVVHWLSWLDTKTQLSSTNDPETKAFLNSVLDFLHTISPDATFSSVFNSKLLWKASSHLSNLQNSVMTTFLWDAPRPASP